MEKLNLDILNSLGGQQEGSGDSVATFLSELIDLLGEQGLAKAVGSKKFADWFLQTFRAETGLPILLARPILYLLRQLAGFVENKAQNLVQKKAEAGMGWMLEQKSIRKIVSKSIVFIKKFNPDEAPPDIQLQSNNTIKKEIEELQNWIETNNIKLDDINNQLQLILDLLKKHELVLSTNTYSPTEDALSLLIPYTQGIQFRGRDDEIRQLDGFANDMRLFGVWVMIGPSGSGKTRLSIEWMKRNKNLWNCGFVDSHDEELWSSWVPIQPTFIVIDYFHLGRTAANQIIKRCQSLVQQDQMNYPVRLLILEHLFDFGSMLEDAFWSKIVGTPNEQRRLEGFMFAKTPLSLEHVGSEERESMMENIITQSSGHDVQQELVQQGMAWLHKTPGAFYPLFAALIGYSIKNNKEFGNISRRHLLETCLTGEKRLPWRLPNNEKEGVIAGGYVCYSTIAAGAPKALLDKTRTAKENEAGFADFRFALNLAQRIVSQPDKTQSMLNGLLPDILGETFILAFFKNNQEIRPEKKQCVLQSIYSEQDQERITAIAVFFYRTALNIAQEANNTSDVDTFQNLLPNSTKATDKSTVIAHSVAKSGASNGFAAAGNLDNAKKFLCGLDMRAFEAACQEKKQYSVFESIFLRAVQANNTHLVKSGLDANKELPNLLIDSVTPSVTLLMLASESGHDALVSLLIEKGAQVNLAKTNGFTALMLASQNGHDVVVNLLIEKGAQLDLAKTNGFTALMLASESGHDAIASLLLEKGAQINLAATDDGSTALMLASKNGHDALVNLLLEKGAQINLAKTDGFTALTLASQSGHDAIASLLLEKGAQINLATTYPGFTALTLASLCGHDAIVSLLLEKGAQLDLATTDGSTALMLASEKGHDAIASLLIKKGAQVNLATTDQGSTALMAASQNGHDALVSLLIEKGAQVNLAKTDGFTALMLASQNGHDAVVSLLIEKGAQINLAATNGATALMLASQNGHDAIVSLLIEKGAQINLAAPDGFTALMAASLCGHDAIASLLIKKGAPVNLAATDGATALMLASQDGHDAVASLLIEKGAQVNLAKTDGATALMLASQDGHDAVASLLIEKGAQVNLAKTDGATALMLASQDGHDAVASLLIEKGAQVNLATTDQGSTALMAASQSGHDAIVSLLIEKGAQVNLATANGFTALMLASENGHDAIVSLLIEKGAH